MSDDNPQIQCLPDGPYLLKKNEDAKVSLHVTGADGETVSEVTGVALCRCGDSRNKPFCDGTHKNNGFSDKRLSDGSADSCVSYEGSRVTIRDNRGICAHAGICTDRLASVFRMGQEPWIDADGASVEAIVEAVDRCPSGAITCTVGDVEHRPGSETPEIRVIKDGPYQVGSVDLEGHAFGDGVTAGRYTLCRCGASKNKPFCDGSHWDAGFSDDVE